MYIQNSELILNKDGSIYHLNLKPEHIADDFIFVGDQDRVNKVTKHFDSIEFTTQERAFKTATTGGFYGFQGRVPGLPLQDSKLSILIIMITVLLI